MEPSELRRGMSGFGLTTFQGTQIDTFQVEILGVLKGYLGPRMDMILARLSGGPLEHTGVIRGMSGSPVYIDGRLIGAIAYGWSFSKDPIGGITPIAHMLDVAMREHPPPSQYGKALELDEETTRLLGGEGVSTLAPLGDAHSTCWLQSAGAARCCATRSTRRASSFWTARRGRDYLIKASTVSSAEPRHPSHLGPRWPCS